MARAYTAARELFETRELWTQIEALDNKVPAQVQYSMLNETSRLLGHLSYWLLKYRQNLSIDATVRELRGAVRTLTAHLAEALAGQWRNSYQSVLTSYTGARVPHALAKRLALLDAQNCALDIVELALAAKVPGRATPPGSTSASVPGSGWTGSTPSWRRCRSTATGRPWPADRVARQPVPVATARSPHKALTHSRRGDPCRAHRCLGRRECP